MKRVYILAALLLFILSAWAQTSREKQIYILHTSDTHSRIEPISPTADDKDANRGGVVRRATFVKQYRTEHPDVLLFDCGDISQGTPYYNLFQGELEVKMMNLMGYDAMTIGNHEFDFGLENMARLFTLAEFPVVCANYQVTGTVLEGLVKPYITLERNGLKIGVFGLSPRMEGLVQSDKCEGLVYLDPIKVAQEMADTLREQEECDVVICLSHLGYRLNDPDGGYDENLAAKTHGIDLILGGHTHTFMERPAVYLNEAGRNVTLWHSGARGVCVGEVTMTVKEK